MNSSKKGRFFGILMLMMTLLMASATVSFATPPDSLKTRWVNGKKYSLYKVVAKDTWSSLSRKFKMDIKLLQDANPGVSVLKTGQIIQIPFVENQAASETTAVISQQQEPAKSTTTQQKEKTTYKYHTVQKGETLYRISKEYNMSVDELKDLNNITSNNVVVGMKLKVGTTKSTVNTAATTSVPIKSEPAPVTKDPTVPTSDPVKTEKPQSEPVKEPVKEPVVSPVVSEPVKPIHPDTPAVYSNPGASRTSVTEKDPKTGAIVDKITENGVATWIVDGELNQNKFYALHRTAPVGTIIKVTNRMNNNSVFVKVIGFLPDTGDNANIIIKITQAAAQRIGAIDQRFTAELTYGINK